MVWMVASLEVAMDGMEDSLHNDERKLLPRQAQSPLAETVKQILAVDVATLQLDELLNRLEAIMDDPLAGPVLES